MTINYQWITAEVQINETTDKGYINQSAVLNHRGNSVNRLFEKAVPDDVYVVDAV